MSATEKTKLTESPKGFYFLKKQKSQQSGQNAEGQRRASFDIDSAGAAQAPPGWSATNWVTGLFGGSTHAYQAIEPTKPRKVPIKVEPKVYFANERTFLAWLHMAITLASISVAIVAFAEANDWSHIYGLLLMPVAIAFCAYSLWMYIKRSAMIRRKDPGPYEDKVGPVLLSAMLGLAILVNFVVKMYDYAT